MIILVECGLELIPKEVRSTPSVRKTIQSRNYASQLLDNALHHSAMKSLKHFEKRGRPDILHSCLLNALGSPLNKSGLLTIYIHTIHGKIFKIDPELRIARNYNRFKGLMAKLLIDEKIGVKGSELISLYPNTLKDLFNTRDNQEIIIFSTSGEKLIKHDNLFPSSNDKEYIAIIGGFQKNSISKEFQNLSDKMISLSSYSLDAWIVVSKVINYFEIATRDYF